VYFDATRKFRVAWIIRKDPCLSTLSHHTKMTKILFIHDFKGVAMLKVGGDPAGNNSISSVDSGDVGDFIANISG
jgi:hypothetical protein